VEPHDAQERAARLVDRKKAGRDQSAVSMRGACIAVD
jgi:hypothetical protein